MSVSATNCRRLCQCFLQKTLLWLFRAGLYFSYENTGFHSAVQGWSVFPLRKTLASIRLVVSAPLQKTLLSIRVFLFCVPFGCSGRCSVSTVTKNIAFHSSVLLRKTLLSIRLFRTGDQCFSLRKTAFRWLFKVALDMFSQHSINKECLHSPDKMLLVLQVLLMSCL